MKNDGTERALDGAEDEVEPRLARLYEALPIACFAVDDAGTILHVNAAALEVFRSARSSLEGRRFEELVAPAARDAFGRFRAGVRGDAGRPVHDTILAASARSFHARITAAPLAEGALLCVSDETERVQAEEDRRRHDAEVAEALRLESLAMLAGGVAHDFNNVLSIVLAYAELVLLDGALAPPTQAYVREMQAAARRAAALSRQMLTYTGRAELQAEPLDLSEVIRSLDADLAGAAPSGALVLDLADDLPVVAGERAQIQQIVLNLVVNAAEAIGAGGQILVRTRVGNGGDGRRVVLEVVDDGRGMDPGTRRRAFDPFFSTKFPGRGLGLAVVHGAVRAHGGKVSVDTEPERGATFRVELPTSSPGRGAANDVATEVPWRGAGLVLVVDDSDEVRELVGRVLERMGFEVCYASDGVDALAVAGRTATRLACVLLDLTMPRLGGLGALAELKRVAPEVPVVLMSGYPSDTLEEADVRRADGFIAKPFTLAAIREAMQSVLAARAR